MRRVRLWQVLAIAIGVELVGLLATALTTFLADRAAGAAAWLATPIAAVVAGGAKVLTDALSKDPEQPPPPPLPAPGQAGPPPWYPPPPRRRGTTSVLTAVVVVVGLIGVGGYAAASGVRYAVGYLSGNEHGTDVLARPASRTAAGISVTVRKVERTRHFTRVEVLVRNDGRATVSLPLFGNCTFRGADGTVVEAEPFKSDWSTDVPPGGVQRGTVTFDGKLPPNVTRAALAFGTIFRLGGGSVTVPVELRPSTA